MSSNTRDGAVDGERTTGVSVARLRSELPDEGAGGSDATDRSAAVLDAAASSLFEGDVDFDEGTVRNNLDEILVALVALEGGKHGKELMEDLETVFDADLSPGTVYPRLHELDDDELLEVRELVRSKEYDLGDREAARERLAASMRQHLVLGRFLRAALGAL